MRCERNTKITRFSLIPPNKFMNIKEARERLEKEIGDDESYHSEFDDILEERLTELDPEFMKAMEKEYQESGMSRWCA